jgi:hypothetical protein
MTVDDEGDFKKARGFLLTYSCLVVALWFFKAELTQFNLMGVSLTLAHHKESIWMVLAILNAYFWFRFYQRLPSRALYFDESMHELYDKALVWLVRERQRRAVRRLAKEKFEALGTPLEQFQIYSVNAEATGRHSLEEDRRINGDEVPELHQISRENRTKMYVSAGYNYTSNGKWLLFPVYAGFFYQPGIALTWTAKTFAIVRGAFVTPWFTDFVAPLALGGLSTAIALWKWWEVNFAIAPS